jgi:hypothetical protein
MFPPHSIIPYRMKLRGNNRATAIREILSQSPGLLTRLEEANMDHPQQVSNCKQTGAGQSLNHIVVFVLDTCQPGWARNYADKASLDIDDLTDHDFWVDLYDLLWRCVVEAELKKGWSTPPLPSLCCAHFDC